MIPGQTSNSATAWLIRHGQSEANADRPVHDFAAVPLTELGSRQAELFAERFDTLSTNPPTLIVQSPYLRARQTATPLRNRFPQVPVETWPIQEFTYLDPREVTGLTETQRRPFYERYWLPNDPAYCEGGGAESFTNFLNRVREMLSRLSQLSPGERVVVFGHGYVMQAVRLLVLFPGLSDSEMMWKSRVLNDAEPIPNTGIIELQIAAGVVEALGQEHITPLTLEGVLSHE
jgi:2,3-bisphosphoglycerate-dependent phosphoglycerate mutase